ncbi:MAG: helix-turn-helix transcriptional regulator [Pseudomonadota bacterium]
MSQIAPLLSTLKRELKARGITYAGVSRRLSLSESTVKRMFSGGRVSLERLEQLCQLIDFELSDLVQKMAEERQRTTTLTEEQEREVVEDSALLLVAISVLNRWTFDDILSIYAFDEHEVVQLLARLDRIKLIELLPGNRIRLIVTSSFRWLPNGPVQRFFRDQVQPEFLHSSFSGPGEVLLFQSGMLSAGSNAALRKKMERILAEFNELHEQDASLPLEDRFGSSILLALRPWELEIFQTFRREPSSKVFKAV